jgi:hypothetical protein
MDQHNLGSQPDLPDPDPQKVKSRIRIRIKVKKRGNTIAVETRNGAKKPASQSRGRSQWSQGGSPKSLELLLIRIHN